MLSGQEIIREKTIKLRPFFHLIGCFFSLMLTFVELLEMGLVLPISINEN